MPLIWILLCWLVVFLFVFPRGLLSRVCRCSSGTAEQVKYEGEKGELPNLLTKNFLYYYRSFSWQFLFCISYSALEVQYKRELGYSWRVIINRCNLLEDADLMAVQVTRGGLSSP